MVASVLRRATFIGRLRYLLLDRYYNRTVPIIMVIACVFMTLLSTVLLKDAYGPKVILGFAPVLILAGLAGFLFLYFNMHLLPAIILIITLLLHEGIGTGTGTKITFTFVLLIAWMAVWLFKMFVVERKVDVFSTPSNVLALLFMAVVVISYFWSYQYAESNVRPIYDEKVFPRLMTAIVLIISPGAYFLYANHLRSMKMIRFFVWFFLAMGLALVVARIVHINIPLLNSKGQFPAWAVGLALAQLLFNKSLKPYIRLGLIGIIGGWAFVQFVQSISWLSGWLPLSVAAGVVLFFYSRRLFFVALIAVGTFYFARQAAVQSTFSTESAVSGETRLGAWEQVITLTSKHYLFGTGPAGYQFYFSTYQGYMYQLSHNNYVDILAQTGLVGLLTFVGFWLSTTIMTLRLYFALPKKHDFVHALGVSLVAFNATIYVTMMLGDWITPFTYTQGLAGIDYTIWPWMMTGLTVALYYHIRNPQPEPNQAPALVEAVSLPTATQAAS